MAKPRHTGLPEGAWVLVADGEKALFLVNRGDDEEGNAVREAHILDLATGTRTRPSPAGIR